VRGLALVAVSVAVVVLMLFAAASLSASTDQGLAVGGEDGCDGVLAESVARTFLAALARGDVSSVVAAFASEPGFGWYSTTAPGARRTQVAEDRSSLIRYFRKRVAQRERMRITKRISGTDVLHDRAYLNGQLVRRARDLKPTRFNFKMAVTCSAPPQIIVWSMARDASAPPERQSR
jgi:hypothetical protein